MDSMLRTPKTSLGDARPSGSRVNRKGLSLVGLGYA